MSDLLPFAASHVGVSLALAVLLLLIYKRLQRADFLLYWAIFWVLIAVVLAASRIASPLLSHSSWAGQLLGALTPSLTPFFPVLMICAALSVGGGLSKRTAGQLLSAAGALTGCLFVYFMLRPTLPGSPSPVGDYRPVTTSLAVVFFAYRLAVKGGSEVGGMRAALVVLSLLYSVHNFALGSRVVGLTLYPPGGYSPWSATIGMLLQFGLTIVFAYWAIGRASEASAEARESNRRLLTLLDSVGVAGLILDRRGRVAFCNRWLSETLEQAPDAISGSPWFESFVPAREREQVRAVFESGFATGRWPAIHEYAIQAGAHRELNLQWYHTSLRDTGGMVIGAASLGLDLSQQHLLEEQVRQTQKMETLGRLAGGVAHDFNNHLTVINGFADLLLSRLSADSAVRSQIQAIRDSGEHAATLTRQLLTFSRKQKVAAQPVSLNQTVQSVEQMLRRLIREDITLRLDLESGLGFTLVDPGQLEQVLLNLVVNANDAITGPGIIQVRTRPSPVPDGVNGGREFLILTVEDDGSGMDEWTRQRVFDPFFTSKEEGKGTGLGLATVHGIVTQAGGWIDVTSQPGAGSVFSVYLPRVEAGPEAEPQVAPVTAAFSQGTVLLVEDQEAVRSFAREVLAGAGYRVLEASSGRDALRIAADRSEAISVLVSDVVMPEMSGDELAGRLRAVRPGLPALFVSGYSFNREFTPSTPAAPHAFLQKPYTPEQLCEHIARLIDSPVQPA